MPTLYAADSEAGALSERVFRDVPVAGTGSRHKPRADLRGLVVSRLVPLVDLCLAELHGHGPAMIGASDDDLFGPMGFYEVTAAWAKAIRWGTPRAQGLVWMSRQDNTARALMLWYDRVGTGLLQPIGAPEPIDTGPGLRRVEAFAERVRIVLV